MENIKKLRIDLNMDSFENVVKIKRNIDEFAEKSSAKELSLELSEILGIPSDIVEKKLKQIIYGKFDYYNFQPKFKLEHNIFDSLKYFILFIFYIFFNNLSKFIIRSKQNVSIILDNVEGEYVLEKFSKILSYFEKPMVLINKLNFKKNKSYKKIIFLNIHLNTYSHNTLKNKNLLILKFLKKLFFESKKNNLNFLKLFFPIFYTYLKYSNIFYFYKSKYLIHDRIYHTCPIRNFIFKKYGGEKIICLQTHLAEATISVFSDIDTLATFGKEKDTIQKLKFLGGKINNSTACGSLRMEHELKDENKCSTLEPIDILAIGLNPAIWRGTSNKILEIYYEQMKWISKISTKFPKLKIVYKHHPNFTGDKIETKFINSSNIKTIVKPGNNLNSYHYLMRSNLVLSFGSTMILEGLSLGKKCFFLDPELKNTTFFGNLDYLKQFRISKYEDLETIVRKNLINYQNGIMFEPEKFCLSHKEVSKKVYEYISGIN